MLSILSFVATPSNIEFPVGLTVKLNDQTVFDCDSLTQRHEVAVEFDNDAQDAEYLIEITLKNKTLNHTKIDNSGNIIEDSLINISSVKLEDIDVEQLFYEKSVYRHSFNNNDAPADHRFFGDMGCNGTVIFKFTAPSYLWLLEHM